MYGNLNDIIEVESWNTSGSSTQYWLRKEELKLLMQRIQSIAEQRAETNANSQLRCAEHEKLNYPIR
ncbi:MAG: hypothetical protein U0103_25970 [Candidatus Obscuribacterales bacterium]|jgi:hypothetical protein|nr:hypothetical protein [Cyanobacteria bacterium SZAS LIN-5]RTL36087.1 MAG: hypothetical protein EKK48_27425 [Candidatus Melainabacteria bacterium]